MARPRKLPENVILFKRDETRTPPRAKTFEEKAKCFKRERPPERWKLIFEYTDSDFDANTGSLHVSGWYENGKPTFYNRMLDADYQAGKIKILSWRLANEWHGGMRKTGK